MKTFSYGGQSWQAWSEMSCRGSAPHGPHVWAGEFTLYGPYMCWGTDGGPRHRGEYRGD